jgi:SAM-dependent methyltransferase
MKGSRKGVQSDMEVGTPVDATCPSCGSRQLYSFYEARNVPVHSCLMMASREEALSFPTGDVALAFCTQCGFITNVSYEPSHREYAPGYEDQQSFSPTFNAFARRLAAQLIDRYDLRGKDIVEIGCGKADFLALLCELGDNRGVGIDPACIRERIEGEAAARITVIQDYYSEKYADYTGDLVLCRHTLEHIHRTAEFVTTVRRGIGEREGTAVFFEVPDTVRVLREQAFWDIYYEHCSYFTPGSLARLFRRCGFAVDDVALDYDDQYLLLYAHPVEKGSAGTRRPSADGGTGEIHPLEESVDELSREVDRFGEACAETTSHWLRTFERYAEEGKRVAVWGSGSKCVAFLTTLGIAAHVDHVVDINPHRHGKFIPGAGNEVLTPDSLRKSRPDVVVVMNPVYREEIADMLAGMGLEPEIVTV